MNKKTSISKLLIGAFYLAIYCNVLFTQLYCNFSYLISLSATENEHTHGHEHPHGNDVVPVAEHNHDEAHQHESSRNDGCCKDQTTVFFASQANPVNPTIEFKKSFFTEFTSFYNVINVINFSSFNSQGYFSYKPPPPKIPDIRIFIQSFLI